MRFRNRSKIRGAWMSIVWICGAVSAVAQTPVAAPSPSQHADHSRHRMAMKPANYTKSLERYAIPKTTLFNQDGEAVDLTDLVDVDHPVALTFIFTTCTTICPVMTATVLKMQRELNEETAGLHIVTITIDPEYDTPKVLKEYSTRYEFGPNWDFLTGQPEEIIEVLKAFNAYYGDKMNHRPLYFFRRPGDESWLRIEGLARGNDMVAEYRELLGN